MACPLSVLGICIGTVIFIQSGSVSNHWMDAYPSGPVRFTRATLEHIQTSTNSEWAKWILQSGGTSSDTVMLESVRYRNYYLDTRNAHYRYSRNPSSETWTKWKLTKEGSYHYLESVQNRGHYLEIDHYEPGWWSSAYYRAQLSSSKGTSTKMKIHECWLDTCTMFPWTN